MKKQGQTTQEQLQREEEIFDPTPFIEKFNVPREQVMEIRQQFDVLDQEARGYLEPYQFRDAFEEIEFNQDPKLLLKLFEELEEDYKTIDFETFFLIVTDKLNNKNTKLYAQRMFEAFDEKREGKIGWEQLYAMSHLLGENLSEKDCQNLLEKADLDEDGYLTSEDFFNLLNRKVYWDDEDDV